MIENFGKYCLCEKAESKPWKISYYRLIDWYIIVVKMQKETRITLYLTLYSSVTKTGVWELTGT